MKIFVVAFDAIEPNSVSGFDWYPNKESADDAFESAEKDGYDYFRIELDLSDTEGLSKELITTVVQGYLDYSNWAEGPETAEISALDYTFTYSIDIPQCNSTTGLPSDEWRCIAEFKGDKQAAIDWAMKHLGADENGMICVLSEY